MLICLSASHKNSSFDVLEKLSVGAEATARDLLAQNESLNGAVVVATCNRFEAYIDLGQPFGATTTDVVQSAVEAVSANTGVATDVLRDSLDLVHGAAVAQHLFSVTSGLESVVVGEGEIAGQVRRSLEAARAAGTTSPELERLFQRASQTSRGVKNRTGIGSAGRSLVRLALDLAESRVTDWAATRVLLVGTGRYAGASLAALRDRGALDVRVYSPSGRGLKFATSHGIAFVPEGTLPAEAAEADVIVTCTVLDRHVIDASVLRDGRHELADVQTAVATAHLPGPGTPTVRRQLIIDLGLPRNVDPDVTEVDGVELLDLETIKLHAPLEELDAASEARELVGRAARKFSEVATEQSLSPAVVALRTHVFTALDAEIERARSRGEDSAATEAALRHLAGVLLHTPMVRARELARAGEQQAYVDALDALFGLQVDLEAAAPTAADPGEAVS